MKMSKNSSWRYQAVYVEKDSSNKDVDMNLSYSICEIYLDKESKLEKWTESREIPPNGYTYEELVEDIRLMLNDVLAFKPVPYDTLQVGMTFEANDEVVGNKFIQKPTAKTDASLRIVDC